MSQATIVDNLGTITRTREFLKARDRSRALGKRGVLLASRQLEEVAAGLHEIDNVVSRVVLDPGLRGQGEALGKRNRRQPGRAAIAALLDGVVAQHEEAFGVAGLVGMSAHVFPGL